MLHQPVVAVCSDYEICWEIMKINVMNSRVIRSSGPDGILADVGAYSGAHITMVNLGMGDGNVACGGGVQVYTKYGVRGCAGHSHDETMSGIITASNSIEDPVCGVELQNRATAGKDCLPVSVGVTPTSGDAMAFSSLHPELGAASVVDSLPNYNRLSAGNRGTERVGAICSVGDVVSGAPYEGTGK